MTITIDLDSAAPVYRQIVDAIRAYLVDGTLGPGDQLPPVRQLAVDLGVHFNTVAEAYRMLADEGWLDLRRRRGAVVIARERPASEPDERDRLTRRLRELVAELQARGLSRDDIAGELRTLAEGLES
jgi:DNA-binding transcriptional regulator YhcF (GntR family)